MTARLFAFAMLFGAVGLTHSAHAQSCTQYLANKFVEAKSNAVQCGVSATQIASIDSPSSHPGACQRGPQTVQSQLGAFQACAAVYYCAAEAYRCALRQVSSGASCDSAMRNCIAENPIPQVR